VTCCLSIFLTVSSASAGLVLSFLQETNTKDTLITTMSLEEKFANLKIDDSASVVEAVKSQGVEKSGLAANISVLSARCGSKDDAEAIAAMATVKALAESVPESQPFTKECLGACEFCLNFSSHYSRHCTPAVGRTTVLLFSSLFHRWVHFSACQ
jgi:hypothetical protein